MVMGTLPQCEADEILLKNPVSRPRSTAAAAGSSKFMSQGYRLGTKAEEEARNIADVEAKILQTAQALGNVTVPSTSRRPDVEIISESVRQPPRERIIPIKLLDHNEKEVHWVVDDEENEENAQLQKALAMSLQNYELEVRIETINCFSYQRFLEKLLKIFLIFIIETCFITVES